MENASKALIIAGAILLAILIISLGIMIFNQASGVVDNNAMDEVSVSSFNKKFTQYEGENVKGSNVNAMLDTLIQNNLANTSDASKQVDIEFGAAVTTSTWSEAKSGTIQKPTQLSSVGKALTGKAYKVKTSTDSKSGFVNKVTITAK